MNCGRTTHHAPRTTHHATHHAPRYFLVLFLLLPFTILLAPTLTAQGDNGEPLSSR